MTLNGNGPVASTIWHGEAHADVGVVLHGARVEAPDDGPAAHVHDEEVEDDEPSIHFCILRELANKFKLSDLSMGMSMDFDKAIKFGSTLSASLICLAPVITFTS